MSSINVEEEWDNFEDLEEIPHQLLQKSLGIDYVEVALLIIFFVNFYWFISIHCISRTCRKEKVV